jgi:hypothetical protein
MPMENGPTRMLDLVDATMTSAGGAMLAPS